MSKREPELLVKLKYSDYTDYLIYLKKAERFVPLDEKQMSRVCPGYALLNEKARQRERDSFIKDSEILLTAKLPAHLPNTPPNLCLERLPPEEIFAAVQTILSLGNIFESPNPGHLLLTDILCGLHDTALRKAEPTFSPAIAIRSDSPEILSVLKKLTKSVVSVSRWKGKRVRIRRTAILDYRVPTGKFPRHIQDFSQVKCKVPIYKKPRFPMAYTDTLVLMIGADNAQVREATPYLNNAAVVMLNCGAGDLTPTKLSSADISAYDRKIVHQLKVHRKAISILLSWWWSVFEDEDAWARGIVKDARASFGKPDSRYIRVEPDPKKLRGAIRYRVLLNFFDVLENNGFISSGDLQPYRQTAKDVFDPAPPEAVVRRQVEDPAVFLEIMRDLTIEMADSIVPEGGRVIKGNKPFAAWRTINSEKYLVLAEGTWKTAYARAARQRQDLETSLFQTNGWEKELQKILAIEGVIKEASSGYRYRYDLYGDSTRDKTYVVAIPAHLLEN